MAARRKKLLTFLFKTYRTEIYGGERSLISMLSRVRDVDTTVVLNTNDATEAELRRTGTNVVVLPSDDVFAGFRKLGLRGRIRRMRTWLDSNRRALSLIRQQDPDVIHCNDWPEFFLMAGALLASGKPVLLHLRCEVDMRWHHQLALACASRAVSVSRGIQQAHHARMRPLLRRIAQKRARVLYNGIDLASVDVALSETKQQVRSRLGISEHDVLVLCVGAVEPRKRQREIIEHVAPAINEHAQLRFVFFGGEKGHPEYATECRELIARTKLTSRVTMNGYSPDIFAWYRAADVLLLASMREGLPRCIIEALAFGLPVVAADIPGVSDLVMDGENGFVTPNNRFDEMRLAIERLAANRALRQEMGAKGRAIAESTFRLETCAESFEQIVAELIPSVQAS